MTKILKKWLDNKILLTDNPDWQGQAINADISALKEDIKKTLIALLAASYGDKQKLEKEMEALKEDVDAKKNN